MVHGTARDFLSIFIGFISGALSGAFGVGGAVISTPLIRALGVSPLLAVGTTLPAILPSSLTGTIRYSSARIVHWDIVLHTVPLGVISAVGASYLTHSVPGHGHWLMVATAVIMGVTAFRIGRDKNSFPKNPDKTKQPFRLAPEVLGIFAGGLSGLLGVGGGLITVPGFRQILKLPLIDTIATSLVCVGIFAIPSTIIHARIGDIDWTIASGLILGVIPGSWLGSRWSMRASDRRLRISVSVVLTVIAIIYGITELRGV